MTALVDLFLNSTGRVGRFRFVLGAACLIGAWAVTDLLLPIPGWLHALVAAALVYCGFCVLSQRLHDRGRSGWWSGLILAAFALAWPLLLTPLSLAPLSGVATAALALIAFDLAVLPGQKAFNRYGAAPSVRRQSGATPG
ncbi:DUF805 domain-containing protein [Brevundimonas olei]|uniref:DUF805 domain-containing protein n=1 Tax=Brevundimonas olei TaxID=657642 RepID=UPI0031D957F3